MNAYLNASKYTCLATDWISGDRSFNTVTEWRISSTIYQMLDQWNAKIDKKKICTLPFLFLEPQPMPVVTGWQERSE